MGEYDDLPGPDPSTLEAVDYTPEGVMPVNLSVSYTSNSVSDYVLLKKENGQYTLELAEPLFGFVRKAGRVNNLKSELEDALTAIGVGGIVSHFTSAVSEYMNSLLPVEALPETIALSTAAYLLKKLYDAGRLRLGYIHHATIDELPSWMAIVNEAKRNPDISVS